jgi:SAM-dependent methyltransferase
MIEPMKKVKKLKILDIGCGKKKYPGSIGLDSNPKSDADIFTNIEKKLPFTQNSFDFVYSSHTLEHINPKKLVFVLEEIWRVVKPDGKICLIIPHFSGSGSYTNPTHLRMGFSSQSFKFFISTIDKLANLNPLLCELFWVYWVGGFYEIQFDLKVKKNK